MTEGSELTQPSSDTKSITRLEEDEETEEGEKREPPCRRGEEKIGRK